MKEETNLTEQKELKLFNPNEVLLADYPTSQSKYLALQSAIDNHKKDQGINFYDDNIVTGTAVFSFLNHLFLGNTYKVWSVMEINGYRLEFSDTYTYQQKVEVEGEEDQFIDVRVLRYHVPSIIVEDTNVNKVRGLFNSLLFNWVSSDEFKIATERKNDKDYILFYKYL